MRAPPPMHKLNAPLLAPRFAPRFARRELLLGGALLLAAPLFGFRSAGDRRAPKPEAWALWDANDPNSEAEPDYAFLDGLLAGHLALDAGGTARFDYAAVSAPDRAGLKEFLNGLAAVPVSQRNREVQYAYWCNLYNALTLDVMLDHWPVDSIKDIKISPGFFGFGPWGAELTAVEGEALTLNDIEHRILRPGWGEPRTHYAVNCASVGCPNLKATAWRAASVAQDLEIAARDFINSPRGVRIQDGKVTVSKIYAWFREDFGDSEQGVLEHLLQYAEPELARELAAIGTLHESAYDWTTNAPV